LTPSDIINLGTHGTLILVIFWLLKLTGDLIAALQRNTEVLAALKVVIEDEIAATGGLPSRKN